MAKVRSRGMPETPSSLAPGSAAKLIRQQIDRGKALLEKQPLSAAEREAWQAAIQDLLERAFGSSNVNVSTVVYAGWINQGRIRVFGGFGDPEPSESDKEPLYREGMERQLTMVESCAQQLEDLDEATRAPAGVRSASTALSNRVFVVHGHDDGAREAVARLLSRIGLDPLILREQPNQGRTVIEKFEDYSDVGFAVVLLTPDDRGGRHHEGYEAQCPRARQNVWLELGFFIGKLTRSRVCALYRKGVEIPSDYQGVVLQEFDESEAWKFRLAKEIQAAGYQVDMNHV